jgi:hypothetical protein
MLGRDKADLRDSLGNRDSPDSSFPRQDSPNSSVLRQGRTDHHPCHRDNTLPLAQTSPGLPRTSLCPMSGPDWSEGRVSTAWTSTASRTSPQNTQGTTCRRTWSEIWSWVAPTSSSFTSWGTAVGVCEHACRASAACSTLTSRSTKVSWVLLWLRRDL